MLRPRRFLFLGASALVFGLAALGAAQTVDGKPEVKAEILKSVADTLAKQAFVPNVDFTKWDSFIEAEKKRIDEAKNDEEFGRVVNEALHKFGASHIVLGTPKMAEQRRTQKVVGIGITSMQTEQGLLITRTVADAPAEKGGIKPGDIIIEVEGKKPEGTTGIPGVEGTDVHLKVKHENGKIENFTLTRRPFSTVRKEELTWVNPDTAKVTIYTFDQSYDRPNVDKIFTEASKAKNLILDLRDNGGGMVFNLQHLLGKFIQSNVPVGTFVNRSMVNKYKEDTKKDVIDVNQIAAWSRKDERFLRSQIMPLRNMGGKQYSGNLIVFVNQASGSASEMCAAALREIAGARVIGTKSAGAVLVSVIPRIAHDFTLQYPFSDYVTVRGLRLEGNGVEPDVVADVKFRMVNRPDPAVDKAVLLFQHLTTAEAHASQGGKG